MTAKSLLSIVTVVLISFPLSAAEQPPASKVEIVQPAAGAELHGAVNVQVKITPPEGSKGPTSVYVGLGGAPWTGMKKENGEWAATLDTSLVPNGAQELMVVTDDKKAKATVQVMTKNPLKVFFADLHSHTSYSDGTLTPAVAQQYARDTARLDVFCLTDHLEKVDDNEWLDIREVAWDFNDDGKFVAIPGLEWTKKWGHMNIYDPKTRIWPEDPQEFYHAIADAGVVAKFNHPGNGEKSHGGLAYSEVGDKAVQLMEVRGEEEQKAFIRALDAGWHIAPDGSDDTHSPNWGNCGRWTAILAPGLSKRCLLDALKSRHVYSTLDRNCQLSFTINGATMGDILAEPIKTVEVQVGVQDADALDNVARIELFQDGEVVETVEPNASEYQWKTTRAPEPGKHYLFAKITQADGNLLWSAPIWVTAE